VISWAQYRFRVVWAAPSKIPGRDEPLERRDVLGVAPISRRRVRHGMREFGDRVRTAVRQRDRHAVLE